jgi:hypothetical protein
MDEKAGCFELSDCVVFFNGAACGASAPDHAHFQAGNKGFLPIEREIACLSNIPIVSLNKAELSYLEGDLRKTLILRANGNFALINLFTKTIEALEKVMKGDVQSMINILVWWNGADEGWTLCLFPRRQHRPQCYGTGEGQFVISPAAVDLGGVPILPVEKDFKTMTDNQLREIMKEVCLSEDEFNRFKQLIKQQL